MEAFALYLLKSVIWLTGFALVYILFLKNERFFELNRIFLITGILAAFIFPFITIITGLFFRLSAAVSLKTLVVKCSSEQHVTVSVNLISDYYYFISICQDFCLLHL